MYKTFVINMEKDTERMQYMRQHLDELSIDFVRLEAINGRDQHPVELYNEEVATRANGKVLMPGEVGCALSHRRVYQEIVAQGLDFGFVLEDDMKLASDCRERLEDEMRKHSQLKWDYLLLDYLKPGLPFITRWLGSLPVQLKQGGAFTKIKFLAYFLIKALYIIPLSFFEGWRNFYKKNNPGPVKFYRPLYLAGAYVISRRGAEIMLSMATPVVYPADKLPNQARIKKGLRFYGYAPLVAEQKKDEFESTILNL